MTKMYTKSGGEILNAHPSKIESLKNQGWLISGDEPKSESKKTRQKKEVQPEVIDSVEE
tara:strand:+ start:478 stop:654 length:177 start_codon:yes stop_codon:yes gene_type:complete